MVETTGLENRRPARVRGFESLPLRFSVGDSSAFQSIEQNPAPVGRLTASLGLTNAEAAEEFNRLGMLRFNGKPWTADVVRQRRAHLNRLARRRQ